MKLTTAKAGACVSMVLALLAVSVRLTLLSAAVSLCVPGYRLIVSDGSAYLVFWDPVTLTKTGEVQARAPCVISPV
jgi:glutamine cyclotransferase